MAERPNDDVQGRGTEIGSLEQEFERQILINARLSAKALAVVLGVILIVTISALTYARTRGLHYPNFHWIVLILFAGVLNELLAVRVLKHFRKQNRMLTTADRFLNIFIEAVLPTILIMVDAARGDPARTLTGAFTYLYYFVIILSALRLNPALSVFAGFVASLGYGFATFWYWDSIQATPGFLSGITWTGYAVNGFLLFGGGATAAIVSRQIRKRLREAMRAVAERANVVDMFGRHVSPEVVETLLNQHVGEIPQMQEVCVLVLDIRGFSTFAEHAPSAEVLAYLDTLWGLCVRIVNRHQGIVNKFLGDGFMAIFGAPIAAQDYRENAVLAAREIITEIDRRVAAGQLSATRVGIGIHAGPALVGTVGPDERKEYTVLGDVVNVAFRIEELNKRFGSVLLISDAVRPVGSESGATALETLPIRGRSQSVQVFRLA